MRNTCAVCESPAIAPAFTVGDLNQQMTAESFDYLRCSRCGSVFIAEIPRDLGRYYGRDYSPYTWREPARFERMVEAERPKLEVVTRFARRGALLEIGAAAGAFAVLAARHGFDVTAVEMDAESCTFMASQGIRAVHSADVVGALRALPAFDAIVMWHVIEHLPNPGEVLRAVSAKLRPGGTLLVATPNPASPEFRLFGRRWVHLDAPRHLSLIPRSALDGIAAAAGLSPARLDGRLGNDTQFEGVGWFMRSLRHVSSTWPRALAPLRRALTVVGLPLYAGVALLLRRQGNAYTAAYTREP